MRKVGTSSFFATFLAGVFLVASFPALACACFLGSCDCSISHERALEAAPETPPCHKVPERPAQDDPDTQPCSHNDCCCGELSARKELSSSYIAPQTTRSLSMEAVVVVSLNFQNQHLALEPQNKSSPQNLFERVYVSSLTSYLSQLQRWIV